jgi:hypothetical protein
MQRTEAPNTEQRIVQLQQKVARKAEITLESLLQEAEAPCGQARRPSGRLWRVAGKVAWILMPPILVLEQIPVDFTHSLNA